MVTSIQNNQKLDAKEIAQFYSPSNSLSHNGHKLHDTGDALDQLLNALLDLSPKSTHKKKKPTNILFVGDSFTYKNHMYKLLQYFLGPNYHVDIDAKDSTSLAGHLRNDDPSIQDQLDDKSYKYVVLQDLSLVPLNKDKLNSDVSDMDQAINETDNPPNVVLYQTWAHREDDDSFYTPDMSTPDQAQKIIDDSYANASAQNGDLPIVQAGDAFTAAEAMMKNLQNGTDLFADVRHPDAYGSFLVALMFYKYFTGNKAADAPTLDNLPSNLVDTYGDLDPAILKKLIAVADSMPSPSPQ